MIRKIATTILLLNFFFQVPAQKQANNWYFGSNAGIDFNTIPPTVLTNGQINTYEGVSSISDDNGALLFYTDGITVWDKNHTIMPNGTGLLGNGSTSQSALIVPEPGNDSIYYLFAVKDGSSGGLTYSLINIHLNSGNGDVINTSKNIPLVSPTAEKLTATVSQNGTDIWVLVHEWNTNNFYAYLVTSAGVNPPVISSTGIIHTVVPNQIGCMKFSHNGTKLAVAITYLSSAELFDFDRTTGVVSNPITFTSIEDPYGVEFSPDNSKLYFASRAPYTTKALYQYDLNAGNPAAIIASKSYVFQSSAAANNGTLQLGPDKKIYLTRDNSSFLEVINDPDQPAANCGYVQNGFDLSPKSSQQGLPNFITSYFASVSVQQFCFGDSTLFYISSGGLLGAQWDFNDPNSGSNNQAYTYNAAHLFTDTGTYYVQLIQYFTNGNIDTTITTVNITSSPIVNLGTDTSFCSGSSFQLHAGPGYSNYLWQDGSADSVFNATIAGNYWVTVTNGGCQTTDSISLSVTPCNLPVVSFYSTDTSFCEKKCLDFFDISTNNPTSWQWLFPGADSTTSNLQNPTNICYNSYGSFDVTLIACNAVGCDTLFLPGFINEYQAPTAVVMISGDTLFAPPGYTYQWWNVTSGLIAGAINQYYIPQQFGSYFVIITDSVGCSGSSNNILINGLQESILDQSGFQVSPNPSAGMFTVFANQEIGAFSVRVYNTLGQSIFYADYQNEKRKSVYVNLGEVPKGIYFLELSANEKLVTRKVVIN